MRACSLFLIFLIGASCAVAAGVPEQFVYKNNGVRDPFMSLVTKDGRILPGAKVTTETGDVNLEGIIWDPAGKSLAIINGKAVKKNDFIFGLTVLEIKEDSVVLEKMGKEFIVKVRKGGDGHEK